ncbi:MAG: hypothetical protein IKX86_00790 [Clostridia bacterium]|nr:hypothetical protein [Clostridia bacterium]MBR5767197.1 hypothetical protein [Clostridia bacterium]
MKKAEGAGRLPEYYRLMRSLLWQNVRRTSSIEIASRLGVSPSTVRKDLEQFSGCSRSGYGIDAAALFRAIGKTLGMGRVRTAVVFSDKEKSDGPVYSQFEILGVMDAGRCDAGDIAEKIRALKPEILIIRDCADPGKMPEIVSRAVGMGIRGILDYTRSDLGDIGCPVVRVDPVDAMTDLIFQMTCNEKESR